MASQHTTNLVVCGVHGHLGRLVPVVVMAQFVAEELQKWGGKLMESHRAH
jgi:hypothetical protein